MPTTVPNRPTNGAVEPTVARKARPLDSFAVIAPWLRASEFEHPVVLVDRVGQLVVLLLGEQAVVDDLAIGAVLVELVGALAQVGRLPEAGAGAPALLDDLLLLEQLDEEDVPGADRHDDEDAEGRPGDDAALLEGGHEAIGDCSPPALLLVLPCD